MTLQKEMLRAANKRKIDASVAAGGEDEVNKRKRIDLFTEYTDVELPPESSDESWLQNQIVAEAMGDNLEETDFDFSRDLLRKVSPLTW